MPEFQLVSEFAPSGDQPAAIEALLKRLIDGEAGILSLSIERAGLHDAFVEIAGEAAARALEEDNARGAKP